MQCNDQNLAKHTGRLDHRKDTLLIKYFLIFPDPCKKKYTKTSACKAHGITVRESNSKHAIIQKFCFCMV